MKHTPFRLIKANRYLKQDDSGLLDLICIDQVMPEEPQLQGHSLILPRVLYLSASSVGREITKGSVPHTRQIKAFASRTRGTGGRNSLQTLRLPWRVPPLAVRRPERLLQGTLYPGRAFSVAMTHLSVGFLCIPPQSPRLMCSPPSVTADAETVTLLA